MIMLKKVSILLFLLSMLNLSACGNKPYGHYEDNKMIGIVQQIQPENNLFEVDISQWHKRDVRGSVNDYGVTITVPITDELVIKNEDGTLSDLSLIKIGQKVLVNPPKDVIEGEYKAKEVILLNMTYEEKYDRLLSKNKDKYLTTVFWGEMDTSSSELESKLIGLVSHSTINFSTYPEKNYVVNYEKELDIEKYPVMLVFDTEKLVFKTYDVDELIEFFNT